MMKKTRPRIFTFKTRDDNGRNVMRKKYRLYRKQMPTKDLPKLIDKRSNWATENSVLVVLIRNTERVIVVRNIHRVRRKIDNWVMWKTLSANSRTPNPYSTPSISVSNLKGNERFSSCVSYVCIVMRIRSLQEYFFFVVYLNYGMSSLSTPLHWSYGITNYHKLITHHLLPSTEEVFTTFMKNRTDSRPVM